MLKLEYNKYLKIFFFGFVLLMSCSDKNENSKINEVNKKADSVFSNIFEDFILDSNNASCPYFTKDNKGNIVISWITKNENSEFEFCYSVADQKNSFNKTVKIPGSNKIKPNGENLPRVIYNSKGDIIALWGVANPNPKNQYSGLIYYSVSNDNGINWADPQKISQDSLSIDQRYFSVTNLPNGNIGAIWLDNRFISSENGSSLFFAELDSSYKFVNEKIIAETVCECCRTNISIDEEGIYNITFRDILQDSLRDIVYMYSSDSGKTFSTPERIRKDNWAINGCPHTGPGVSLSKNNINFVWHTMGNGKGVFYTSTKNFGKTFSEAINISNNPSAKHQQIINLKNESEIIIWDETDVNINPKNERICLISKNGNNLSEKFFVSNPNFSSTFPALIKIDDSNFLIAYTQTEKTKKDNNSHSNHSHSNSDIVSSKVIYKKISL